MVLATTHSLALFSFSTTSISLRTTTRRTRASVTRGSMKTAIPSRCFSTATNHLENHFTVGPAILWAPFLIVAHVGVLIARALGSSVAADGFSAPYRFAMALGTAVYGFLGLLLAMRIAAKYAGERWAFSRRWRSGGRVRCLCTCISIRRGRMRIRRSWSRCSFGIGTRRAKRGARCSGCCWPRSLGYAQRLLSKRDGARGVGRRGCSAILRGAAREAAS